jgi:hypothetical protein
VSSRSFLGPITQLEGDSTTFRKLAMLVALAVVATFATAPIQAGDSKKSGPRGLKGVWQTVVTGRNCQTGDPLGPLTIRGLFTFHAGGTMSEYGIGPGASPALRSPGHGIWQREHGWREYSFVFTYNRYDATGLFVGTQEVRASLELAESGDEITTSSAVNAIDPNGNIVGSFCATATGTRFE